MGKEKHSMRAQCGHVGGMIREVQGVMARLLGRPLMLRRSSRILKRFETSAGKKQENEDRGKEKVDGTNEIKSIWYNSGGKGTGTGTAKTFNRSKSRGVANSSQWRRTGTKGVRKRKRAETTRDPATHKPSSRREQKGTWRKYSAEDQPRRDIQEGGEPGQKYSGRGRQTSTRLERLSSITPERVSRAQDLYLAPVPGVVPETENSMDLNGISASRGDNQSAIKENRGASNKINKTKLRYRCISWQASKDEKLDQLRTKLTTQLPSQTIRAVPGLLNLLRSLADDAKENADEI
ncbi:hypothetical protein EV356DRAFT_514315 [Viridothelium virens]|uniref:Uncharacterized protein n=1 Tax=Viridothelium virens TaxID=1048519 RepID=A0A6A6HBK2_VIRVR|nr:hypothetical protein EV356DRAFT_514315 [Viridothelium virens]